MIVATIGFVALFALLALGLPLAVTMLLVGTVGFGVVVGWGPALSMVASSSFDVALNYNLTVLPLFILMGSFIHGSRLSGELYDAAYSFLGHFRGGLAMATVAACGGFSAVSGSSAATTATMGKVAMPAMRRFGYADSLATGSIASGGTLGILIPPSSAMIIYGILTETNIGKLFIAGIIPGLVTIGLYIVAIGIQTSIDPKLGPPGERTPWRQRLVSLRGTWGIMLLFALVMGGIIAGIYTATEAAAVGAVGSFLIALMRRSLTLASLIAILVDACKTTAVLMAVIVAAAVFTNFLDITGTPHHISDFLQSLDMTPMGILIVIICIYLVLGCFLEGMAMMLLTVPLFYPIVASLGFDLVYFGVLVIVVTELAMMTPPIGMNVFILKGTFPEIPVRTIYRGVIPFVGADIVRLILFLMFPAIIMLLPNMAG